MVHNIFQNFLKKKSQAIIIDERGAPETRPAWSIHRFEIDQL